MATFPLLKTGAVMQVPANRNFQFSTDVIQFVDGTEQRFCTYVGPYRKWSVNFNELDETEIQDIRTFVQQMNGTIDVFSFTDPWDGTVYPNCTLEGDVLADSTTGPSNCGVQMTIRENKG